MTWRINLNKDDTVDEVVMESAYVHLEDLGDSYMLIVDDGTRNIHVTIPARKKRKAWIFEQFDPREEAP